MPAPEHEAEMALHSSHIHLPSVHIRDKHGNGFDYDEDLYIELIGRSARRRVLRVVRLVVIEGGAPVLVRETHDQLCREELAQLEDDLPILMDEGNPAAEAIMQECARKECARQLRIAAGEEQACALCGCSETRACSGNCVWATATLCSRCAS
jgi:hypothetical protein